MLNSADKKACHYTNQNNQLPPWHSHFWKANISLCGEITSDTYGTRRFNDVYTETQNWSLSTKKSDKISLTCVLILSSLLYLCPPNDLFLWYLLTITQHAHIFSPMHAECLANLITHNSVVLILFIHAYKSRACSLTGIAKIFFYI